MSNVEFDGFRLILAIFLKNANFLRDGFKFANIVYLRPKIAKGNYHVLDKKIPSDREY